MIARSIAIGVLIGFAAVSNAQDNVSVVDKPTSATRNAHYPSNRDPLIPSPLIKLPVGAVRPEGWLLKQLQLQSEGFHGHLGEISAFLRKEGNAWLDKGGQGKSGWEEVPYWLKGFGDAAYILNNAEQIKEARVWIEAAIASQSEDGFFGPRGKGATATVGSTAGPLDLWPNMVMLNCLQSYHEFTGDQRVIELMTRYFKWQTTVPDKDFLPPYWQQQRAGDNLYSVYWLYNRTGEKWLLDLAARIHRHTANWTDGVPNWHNVNMSQAFGGPTYYWMQSREDKHFIASERNYNTFREMYGQVPGGMFGSDENCRPGYDDPRQAVETCGMVEMMYSCERLTLATGNLIWADRCEDVAFNSLPAALTADLKALRYLTSPNLISSDRKNKSPGLQNGGNMLEMNPHDHRCCQHNFGHGWPYFVEHQWMATPDNGLAAIFFGAGRVRAKVADGAEVTIAQKTDYPFGETVEFTVTTGGANRFPLYLRVPGWCTRASMAINGQATGAATRPRSFIRIERQWRDGDRVMLTLPMDISLRTWVKNHNSVSVDRGPLTYSLRIGEKVVRSGGTDKWPAMEILPTTPWNYGLVLDKANPAGSFEVIRKDWPADNVPFAHDASPIALKARGRKIVNWKADYLNLVGLLQDSPARSNEPEETITLIPMGAARLRISSFPTIGDGPEATEWIELPETKPLPVTASHTFENDTTRAVMDKRLPRSSGDQTIPRFTWWNHKGSKEWIQWTFEKPRKVSSVRVYWFDDEGRGGCRVPASWTLLHLKGEQWLPVTGAGAYGTLKDQFNEVKFDSVETTGLRIEAQLKPDFSGGILEWEIP